MIRDDFLWVEKYRPKTVGETILPESLKTTFQSFVDQKNIPNLLLTGGPGVGKTTIARAMLEELDTDYMMINGSDEGRTIDTLRVKIKQFASSVSLAGGRKYVILDEADYINPESTQPALRSFMEEFSRNCGFILTCNFVNKIITPLHSRCSVINFTIPKEDKPKMAQAFMERIVNILEEQGIEYDQKCLVQIIMKHFPDNRRVLNELQRYSASGKIDAGILVSISDENIKLLIDHMKKKNFTDVRKWVAKNIESSTTDIFRRIYDKANLYAKPECIPQIVVTLADYQYKAAFVADHELNMMACLTEVMIESEWK
jgi:DNA polymerase III delta prime subunit